MTVFRRRNPGLRPRKEEPQPGLKQRIESASTHAEIDRLLDEGSGYNRASSETKARWLEAAEVRRRQIERLKKQDH